VVVVVVSRVLTALNKVRYVRFTCKFESGRTAVRIRDHLPRRRSSSDNAAHSTSTRKASAAVSSVRCRTTLAAA
jgi:hypothetical protein